MTNLSRRVHGGEREAVVLGQRHCRRGGLPRGELQRLRIEVHTGGLPTHYPEVHVAGRAAKRNLLSRGRHVAGRYGIALCLQLCTVVANVKCGYDCIGMAFMQKELS